MRKRKTMNKSNVKAKHMSLKTNVKNRKLLTIIMFIVVAMIVALISPKIFIKNTEQEFNISNQKVMEESAEKLAETANDEPIEEIIDQPVDEPIEEVIDQPLDEPIEEENMPVNTMSVNNNASAISNTDDTWDNSTSTRVFLLWKLTGTFGGVEQKNYIHVYAFDGDTICLGSNVYNSSISLDGKTDSKNHTDKDSVDIVMHDLDGNLVPIDITENGQGHIKDYETEQLAKTMTSPAGQSDGEGHSYVPYTYTVHETGVYTFEFRSYNGNGGANVSKDTNKKNGWDDASTQGSYIAAWDITVFNENNEKETGRTYADFLALQMNGVMQEKYYVMTKDSYIYEMKFNGVSPYTFSFFSNNIGITDSANGNIIYKSVKDLRNTNQFSKFGINYTNPSTDDTDLSKNFYIFFEKPSGDLEGHMYGKAILPDPATNIKFLGLSDGVYEGSGGYFSFDVQEATTATLRLDFNITDTDGNKYAPVEISDVVKPYSTCTFFWDGKDGNGKTIPADSYSYDQIKYTVITKMGEIHFPLIDVEDMSKGTTFTRINKIYNKNDQQVDVADSIYDATKSVIYYDDTAIYYGEKITESGASEKDITYDKTVKDANNKNQTLSLPIPFGSEKDGLSDAKGNAIFNLRNIGRQGNSEYKAYTTYGKDNELRVGDHSFINNKINLEATYSSQSKLIDYLDSARNPVGITNQGSWITATDGKGISGKGVNYSSTTDYGIANYWTFTTSQPVEADSPENIEIKSLNGKKFFNLQARVFYDEKPTNGVYDKQTDGDHLLSGVTLNLYKKSSDKELSEEKTYVYLKDNKLEKATEMRENLYELVKTGVTPLQGSYIFTGLEYEDSGTEYLYEVVRPNSSWTVTSTNKTGSNSKKSESTSFVDSIDPKDNLTLKKRTVKYEYGVYTRYKYNESSKGTEIQTFTVGGTGIEFDNEEENNVTTIDVGYSYDKTSYKMDIRKTWKNENNDIQTPDVAVFEISYNNSKGETEVYEERAVSASMAWNNSFNYLDTDIQKYELKDWFVSAEYYIYEDKIFRHQYQYDINEGIYKSFVGDDSYFSLKEYYEENPEKKIENTPTDGKYTMNNIPDLNNDGVNDWEDIKEISEEDWKEALTAGSKPIGSEGDVVAPFNSVIDRNVGTAVTEINITNASNPGTIEILKYTDEISDGKFLDGATFRIYKGDMETVKKAIDKYNNAQRALSNATESDNLEQLKSDFDEASKAVDEMQLASSTTRINGRVAFPALNPSETYTIRERFAPSGYRILEEFYQVDPYGSEGENNKFDEKNYCLINVGNAKATGDLEIKKTLLGRSWENDDEFKFNIEFSSDKSGITINTTDISLFSTSSESLDDKLNEFIAGFGKEDEITINHSSEYEDLDDGKKSGDTKVYKNLLKNGIPKGAGTETEEASLYNVKFPAAGLYTFTISENDVEEKTTLKSPKVYTVTIDVVRLPNEGVKDNEELNFDNSHLEASVSKITVQDKLETGDLGPSTIYAGNAPTFVNTYVVERTEQEIKYSIKKELTGRENNEWLDSDKFTIVLDGQDEQTKTALKENKITFGKDFTNGEKSEDPEKTEIRITLDSEHKNFQFHEIDFDNITFPVKGEGDDAVTEPVYYYLSIKEEMPQEAVEDVYEGIRYSKDSYTLKITLKNTSSNSKEQQETDGKIDEIIFELYKNYNYDNPSESTAISKCTIKNTIDESGNEKKIEEHDKNAGSHDLVFKNNYEVTIKSKIVWEDNDNGALKRPETIHLKLIRKDTNKVIMEKTLNKDDIVKKNEWECEFKGITVYDENGNLIEYTLEQEKKGETLKFYEESIGNMEKSTEQKHTFEIDITNKFSVPPEKIEIPVEKIWKFANDSQAEKIPSEVKFDVSTDAEGVTIEDESKEIVLNSSSNKVSEDSEKIVWEGKFENLPKYDKNGDEVTYSVSEVVDSIFYKPVEHDKDGNGKVIITNQFTKPETKIEIEVEKEWSDNETQKQRRPDSITINVKKGEEKVATHQIDKEDDKKIQTYKFTELDKYDENGDEITYTIEEEGAGNDSGDLKFYDTEIGTMTNIDDTKKQIKITNTFKTPEKIKELEKVSVTVKKEWNDNDTQKLRRPENIKFVIEGNGEKQEKTVTVNQEKNQTCEFKNLPKYNEDGEEITYQVTEKEVEDNDLRFYDTSIGEMTKGDNKEVTITNTFKSKANVENLERIKIKVNKVWEDTEIQEQRRPTKIQIKLKGNNETEQEKTINELIGDTQTLTFEDLPKYNENGQEIEYSVEESGANSNTEDLKFYDTTIDNPVDTAEENVKQATITNTFKSPEEIKKLEPIQITVKKEWEDNATQELRRPKQLKFVVEGNDNNKYDKTIPTEGENQTVVFENLPRYNENGQEIEYEINEKEVQKDDLKFYNATKDTKNVGNNKEVTIKNTFKSKEEMEELESFKIIVNKKWVDTEAQKEQRPEKISIKLNAINGTEQVKEIEKSADDNQTVEFENLPKYNSDGQEIGYSVEEIGANSNTGNLKFYNTTINDTVDTGEDNVKQITITNTFKSSEQIKKLEPMKITVKKVWEDNDTQKSRRPKQLKFVVEGSDGTQYDETITIEGESQTAEFENLPRYDENGQEIKYEINEEEVQKDDLKFYNATKNTKEVDYNNKEVTIKNTFKTKEEMEKLESFKIIVNKNWVDNETQKEQRPEKIKIKLNAINGTDQEQEIEKSTEDKQTVTFENLPKYNSDGQEIKYSVEEEGANNKDGDLKFYTTEISGITETEESGTKEATITNTFKDINEIEKLEQVNVKVTKKWVENNDKQKAKRPEEITIKVSAENGRKTEETKIDNLEGDTQTYTFKNLPKYNENGQEVQYKVEEVNSNLNTGDLRFYNTTVEEKNKEKLEDGINNEFIITNTFKTLEEIEQLEKVNVTIIKNWDDEGEQKAKRPEQLKFKLMGSNEKTTELIGDVDTEDSKTYTFENLPKFDANGEEVVYRAEELEVKAGDLKFYSTTVQDIENDSENENNKNITITNKFLIPEESLQIKINVEWDDRDNTFNKRPKELILQVKEKATGDVVSYKQITVDEQNTSYTFNNIRKYDEVGNQIEYTIDESEVTENDLFYYTKTIGELVQSKESKTNKVANESEGQLIENIYEGTITNKLTKIPGFIDIEYKDKNTQEDLKTKVTKEGIVGEKLDITPYKEEIDDYVLVQEPEEKSVEFTEKNQTVTYYYAKKTKVTVKYLEKDTNKTLKEDYIIDGYEGAKYTTKAQELQNYDLVESTNNTEGTMPREPIEVIYYYKLVEPNLVNPKITKESTLDNVTENNQQIPYTIKYSVDIDKYIGDATITIVDSLPTAINKDLSSLDGGTYNAENKTITWEEEIKDINTYEDVNDKVSIEKNIEVTYEGLNVEEGNITNSASATITLKTPEKVDIQTTTKVIPTEFTKSITAKKVWNDDNNKAGKRPKQITLVLTGKTANYTKEYSYTINENGSNVWDHTFEDLPKYDSTGKEIQYTIREEDVGSIFYTQESIDQATMTITNKFVVPKEEIEVTVVKEWNDNDNEYNKRPQTLVLQLNSVTKDTTTNTEIENLLEEHTINLQTENSYTFTNLPKYDANGDEIIYRATEKEEKEGDLFHYLGSAGAMQEEETDKYRITLTNVLAKIPGKVKVKYVDKYTEEEISEAVEKEGIVGEEFNVEEDKKNIKGYTLIEEPKSKKGNYTKEDQEKIYYYAKNTSVIVKYLEKDTKKVLTPEESYSIQGYEGKEYTTEQKEIEGYTFVESTENTTGVMARNKIEVIYWYAQNTKATVQHIDKITEEILKETTVKGKVGDLFITHPEDFEGYTLVEEPEERTVPMEKEEVVLKYYYVHASQGVLEKHIDAITGEVLSEELHEGKDGDAYEVKPKEFKGYDLMQEDKEGNSKLPDNNKGKMNKELIEVRYYYLKKATLKVQYIDKETGKALAEDVIVNGHEGDSYTTEQKEFENYKLVENTNSLEGTLTVTLNEKGEYDNETLVQYFYERLEAKVTERHFDITTGELLSEQIHMGKVGDVYDIPSKEFDEYDVAEADSNGNNKLPKNSKGKMTKEDIVVNYYYIRKAEIEIQYVEKESNIPLEIPEIVSGHVGDNYTTEQKQFNYYVFVESTENTQGTMQKDKTTIIYYYRKQTFNLKIDKWISSIIVDGAERAGNTLETKNNMLKIDIPKNKIETTNVKIKYTIRVTNTGEIEGTIRELTESIPNGFTMYQEDNELIWVGEENTYRTTDLKDTAIKPGEYYEVSLVLRWTNSADNFGEKTSKTTISKVNNVAEFEEILDEDNVSEATILMLVKTGMDMEQQIKMIMMEFAILGELMILIKVCVLCKRKINKK